MDGTNNAGNLRVLTEKQEFVFEVYPLHSRFIMERIHT